MSSFLFANPQRAPENHGAPSGILTFLPLPRGTVQRPPGASQTRSVRTSLVPLSSIRTTPSTLPTTRHSRFVVHCTRLVLRSMLAHRYRIRFERTIEQRAKRERQRGNGTESRGLSDRSSQFFPVNARRSHRIARIRYDRPVTRVVIPLVERDHRKR